MSLRFPTNFFWGTSTSAYQVEGGNTLNDWYEWEKNKPYKCGDACDHYNRYEEDFDLAQSLGQNAHRFSIEWSRIEPEEGKFNDKEIGHYVNVVEALRKRRIEPFLTLWHFTNPVWFTEKGGWAEKEAVKHFADYTRKIAEALVDKVDYWITLNEPIVYQYQSFVQGEWPPGKRFGFDSFKILENLVKAHGMAYEILHEVARGKKKAVYVGIAKQQRFFSPYRPSSFADKFACWINEYLCNHLFFDMVDSGMLLPPIANFQKFTGHKTLQDFVGVNYYTRDFVKFKIWGDALFSERIINKEAKHNFLGWEIFPDGFYELLSRLVKYKKPVIVLENGTCMKDDRDRCEFIQSHLIALHRALSEGVDIRGYFYWSLLDNFEWDEAFEPKFGIVEVDMKTKERRLRPSADFYSDICKTGELEA